MRLTKKAVVPVNENGLRGGTMLSTSTRKRRVCPEAMSWYGSTLPFDVAAAERNVCPVMLPLVETKLELLALGPRLCPSCACGDGARREGLVESA
jgi:hypothetical protein